MWKRRLVPSRYLCVFGVREDWGLGWGARGLRGTRGHFRLSRVSLDRLRKKRGYTWSMKKTKYMCFRAPFDTSQWLIGLPCLNKVDFDFDFIVAVSCNLKLPFHSIAIFYRPCCMMDLDYKYKNRGHFDPSMPWLVTRWSFIQSIKRLLSTSFPGSSSRGPWERVWITFKYYAFHFKAIFFFQTGANVRLRNLQGTVKACFFILV